MFSLIKTKKLAITKGANFFYAINKMRDFLFIFLPAFDFQVICI